MQLANCVKPETKMFGEMRVAFILPGLHRINRGAEVAFESVAHELAQIDGIRVTLFGSGQARESDLYEFKHVPSISRKHFEHFPQLPLFRSSYTYEEITFIPGLINKYDPKNYDVVVTCSYPFTNWFLQVFGGKQRPVHIYVTQNGDYEVQASHREYRYFSCDGLICTNPEYFERNKDQWNAALIPNGVDPDLFSPGESNRARFNLPDDVPLVLMVSALIPSKRVKDGICAVSQIEGLHLLICGDGPEYQQVKELGEKLMPSRFHLRKIPREQMPDIYRLADVFLHMSLNEPSANVYIEALATGLPIITHDRFVTQWTLENTSILVNTQDELSLAEGIASSLNFCSENEIYNRRELAKTRFCWAQIAQQYLDIFRKVLLT